MPQIRTRLWRKQGTIGALRGASGPSHRPVSRHAWIKVEDGVAYIDTEGVSPLFASP
jgi:hypothetical protein